MDNTDGIISSYEDFCLALKSENSIADLMLYSRSWFNFVCRDFLDPLTGDILFQGLSETLAAISQVEHSPRYNDRVTHIIEFVDDAFRIISNNLRSKIIRENVLLPKNKIREINSAGIQWLSRKPGRTAREKLSNSLNALAVDHRESLDTGENRVLLAFTKMLNDILILKLDLCGYILTEEEKEFHSIIAHFLRSDEILEIKPLVSFTPNNTLLSDKNYRKILDSWRLIQRLDENTALDYATVNSGLLTVVFWRTFSALSNKLNFPQVPVEYNYDYLRALPIYREVSGFYYAQDGKIVMVTLSYSDTCFLIKTQEKSTIVTVFGKKVTISTDAETIEFVISIHNFSIIILKIIEFSCGLTHSTIIEMKKTISKGKKIKNTGYIDIYAIRPKFIVDYSWEKLFPIRLLRQTHNISNIKSYDLWCDTAKVVMSNTDISSVSIRDILNNNNKGVNLQAVKFIEKIKETLYTNELIYIFPDMFDEFQLGTLRKSINACYKKSEPLPRSIAGVFTWQTSKRFQEIKFRDEDCVIFADVVDSFCSLTLLSVHINEKLNKDIPATKGVVWERHPTEVIDIGECLNKLYAEIYEESLPSYSEFIELLGPDGVASEKGISIFDSKSSEWSYLDKAVNTEVKINLTQHINAFRNKYRHLLDNRNVIILVNGANIVIDRCGCLIQALSKVGVCTGAKNYGEWRKSTEEALWQEHLPKLAIKLLYGDFKLVDNSTVQPSFGKPQEIKIKNTFTLPNGQKQYRFQLVQGDGGTKSKYEAVVKSNVFPLYSDIECNLAMTYTYGSDEPYSLAFLPQDPKMAGFYEAKVVWQEIEEYPYMNLPSPLFPSKFGWDEFQNFPKKDGSGTFDLLDWIKNTLSKFQNLNDSTPWLDKYLDRITLHLPDYSPHWRTNNLGYACYIFIPIDGQTKRVAIYQTYFDEANEFSTDIGDITFSLEPYNDMFNAKYIRVGRDTQSKKLSNDIQEAQKDKHRKNAETIRNSVNSLFAFHTVFSRGYALNDYYCPNDFRNAVFSSLSTLYKVYDEYHYGRGVLFPMMSLLSKYSADLYYPLAFEIIENYRNEKGKLPDNIGVALGDYTTEYEKKLLIQILTLSNEKIICILSNAVWKNKDFIFNAPYYMFLDYFDKAIDFVSDFNKYAEKNFESYQKNQIMFEQNKRSAFDEKKNIIEVDYKIGDVSLNISYILAIFRLRELGDEKINNLLSLNNHKITILYSVIEKLIELLIGKQIEMKSNLKLEVSKPKEYARVPDLLYALLVYITGDTGATSIKISGVDDEHL